MHMWNNVILLAVLTCAVAASLHVEWRGHRRAVREIPIRIHVNGTRGKSSVARLVAATLRAHGVRTVAKTTGTAPRWILPDGTEEPLVRNGPPNIGELTRAMSRARRLGAEAIVFECMAVHPYLQRVAEERIVQPTITVITNARLDHTDVQGTTREEIAANFAVMPGGTLITADPLVWQVLGPRVLADDGAVHLASVGPDGAGEPSLDMPYLEHPDNVAVALEVSDLLGVDRAVALSAMAQCAPDPGRASVVQLQHDAGPWRLVNLFAANDPDSTFEALDTVRGRLPDDQPGGRPILLFAARSDRGARSADFASALADHREEFARMVIWGDGTRALARMARARGVPEELIVDAGAMDPEPLTRLLMDSLDGQRVVVGVGNIVGRTQDWLEHLAPRIERTLA
ncbi:MAG TPA: poly-gamma-glutamate synthase PgsB [Actinomycetota bacterium]|nr:poly-gamma-glutamate synthase PgsB [Actinomycetota bacterium]